MCSFAPSSISMEERALGHVQRSSFPVSILTSLQKSPPFCLETVSPSSREATMKARAPRPNRQGQLRCTTSPPRVDGVLGSHAGARGLVCSFVKSAETRRCRDTAPSHQSAPATPFPATSPELPPASPRLPTSPCSNRRRDTPHRNRGELLRIFHPFSPAPRPVAQVLSSAGEQAMAP